MRLAIISGTVFGGAEEVAYRAAELLLKQGIEAVYQQQWAVDQLTTLDPEAFLFVTSTTGMGELPENLQPLVADLETQQPNWLGRPVGVIGLGDSAYGENFCAAAEQLCELAELLGLIELQGALRLDASESVTPDKDAEPWVEQFAVELKGWA